MVADIVHTFGFSLDSVDEMEWSDMVRWHCQHQRIREEHIQLTQISSQIASASMIQQAFGGGQEEG